MESIQEIFESYPMQKALGSQLFAYCVPSCFLLPFILEPLLCIFIPFHLAKLVLRSRAGVVGLQAEKTLTSWMVMDTGRYADVLINFTLSVLIFFVPGGYIAPTLGALIGSHFYIFLYDHYRVLRCVPGFCYATATIDRCAQKLMAIPCGIMLSCLVFKLTEAVCWGGGFCLKGPLLTLLCIDAFVLHVALHWAALMWLVPRWCQQDAKRCGETFDQVAAENPCTWFSTNPIYCLRSRVFYKHNPPCLNYVRGKEHLMKGNPEALAHFQDKAAIPEDYGE